MKRLLPLALSLLAFAGPVRAEDEKPPAPDDSLHLLFLADEAPVFIKLRPLVNGVPYRKAWSEAIGKVFASLDANQDGVLTDKEIDAVPRGQALYIIPVTRTVAIDNSAQPDHAPEDGKVTPEELERYFAAAGITSFSLNGIMESSITSTLSRPATPTPAVAVQPGQVPGANTEENLFNQLDANGDKTLSPEELRDGLGRLQRKDLDQDETISATELANVTNPYVQSFVSPSNPTGMPNSPTMNYFVSLDRSQTRTHAVKSLLDKYDRKARGRGARDGKLTIDECGFSPELFQQVDADGNEGLDFDEIWNLIKSPPAMIELELDAGKDGRQRVKLVSVQETLKPSIQDAVNSFALLYPSSQLDLQVDALQSGDVSLNYKAVFTAMDQDANGYLDKAELSRQGQYRNSFEVFDKDRDDKIFAEEFLGVISLLAGLSQSRMQLSVTTEGRNFFKILDTNGDNRLSRREFLQAAERVKNWDRNQDNQVALDEFPQQFRMRLGGNQGAVGQLRVVQVGGRMPVPQANPTGSGPRWFQRMDRNQDGDISRREFLGPAETFGQLDRNQDDLISAEEACALEQTARE